MFSAFLRMSHVKPSLLIALVLTAYLTVGLNHPVVRLIAALLLIATAVLLGMLRGSLILSRSLAQGDYVLMKRCNNRDPNHTH